MILSFDGLCAKPITNTPQTPDVCLILKLSTNPAMKKKRPRSTSSTLIALKNPCDRSSCLHLGAAFHCEQWTNRL
jgi:hypothetical protein